MNSKERVLSALNHQEPDRVPVDLGGSANTSINLFAWKKLSNYLEMMKNTDTSKITSERFLTVTPCEKMLKEFHVDTRSLDLLKAHPQSYQIKKEIEETGWGVIWRKAKGEVSYSPGIRPLANKDPTLETIEKFSWPDASEFLNDDFQQYISEASNINSEYATVLNLPSGIFMRCIYLRGFTQFMKDLYLNPKFAEALLDKVMQVWVQITETVLNQLGEYIDIVHYGEDLGMQDRPLIKPKLYRALLKPKHKRIMEVIRSTSEAKILFHSDGSIYPLLPDLIDIGVDAVNPVQPSAANMDPAKLKREYGRNLTFWGGIDTQSVLPQGSTRDVVNEVRKRIQQLAPGGGYVLAAVHNIQPDVPPKNIVAMLQAAYKYGDYKNI